MKIFIDFDDVIFNTKKFKQDLAGIFSAHGISREEYENSYFDPNNRNTIRMHNMEDQIQRLKKSRFFDEKSLRKALNNFMQDSSSYVFEDVVPFVGLHENDKLSVLSFGNKVFQEKKVKSSKIQNYIPDIVITGKTKAEALADIFKENNNLLKEKVLFLDDRAEQISEVKKMFPDVATILIKRPEGRYQDMKKDEYCDFEAHNLQEAQAIIKSLTK
jgi:FMN phosphatase YigB (HAD superfamily)